MKRKINPIQAIKANARNLLALCCLGLLVSASLLLPEALIRWQNGRILGIFQPQPQQQAQLSNSRLSFQEKLSLLSGGVFYNGIQAYFSDPLPYWRDLDYNYLAIESDYRVAVSMAADSMLESAGPADGAESGFSASKGRALGRFHPAAALSFPFRPFPFPYRLANPAAAGRPPAVGISGRRIGPDLLPPAGLQRRFLSLSRRKSYGALGSILGFGDAGLPFHPFWRRNFSEFSIYRRLCGKRRAFSVFGPVCFHILHLRLSHRRYRFSPPVNPPRFLWLQRLFYRDRRIVVPPNSLGSRRRCFIRFVRFL